MADGGSSNSNLAETITQSVVEPVRDEIGKMVEVGVQSITGSGATQDPQEEAKKKADDERKKQNVMRFIQQMQANEQHFREQKNEINQKKQVESEKETEEKQVKQFNIQKKAANTQVLEKQRSVEAGKGKGVGG